MSVTSPIMNLPPVAGIDVSWHNGQLSWSAIAGAGLSFAFAKATDGSQRVDPRFAANWAGMKAAGLLRGAYHFFRPARPVLDQVNLFASTVGALGPGDLPPVLDLEETLPPDEWPRIPAEQRIPLVLEWLGQVESRLGRKPLIYTRAGWVKTNLPDCRPLTCYPLWIAHYTDKPAPAVPTAWPNYTFWQYSDRGSLAGISGPVDLDRFNGTRAELQAMADIAGPVTASLDSGNPR